MDSQRYVFENVTALTVVAIGEPGRRTFYIVVGDVNSWVRVWLEKEALQYLSPAIGELLETAADADPYPSSGESDDAPEVLFEPPVAPAADFKATRLAIGYDHGLDRLGLFVHGPAAGGGSPTLTCWISRPLARLLAARIDEVCAAGRPSCSLCGGSIDPEGHVCPKSNGHRRMDI